MRTQSSYTEFSKTPPKKLSHNHRNKNAPYSQTKRNQQSNISSKTPPFDSKSYQHRKRDQCNKSKKKIQNSKEFPQPIKKNTQPQSKTQTSP